METLKLRDNFYWTGIVDDKLRVFDIIMYTEFGTTYNSYVMKAGDKTILFETAKAKFFDEYLEELKQITDVEKIDYLVVNHTEPGDHHVDKAAELDIGISSQGKYQRSQSIYAEAVERKALNKNGRSHNAGHDYRYISSAASPCKIIVI